MKCVRSETVVMMSDTDSQRVGLCVCVCVAACLHGLVMLPLLGRITIQVLDLHVCCA